MADDSVWVARLVAAARSGTQLDLAGSNDQNLWMVLGGVT